MENPKYYLKLDINTISSLYTSMLIHWYQKTIMKLEDHTTLPYGICEIIKVFWFNSLLSENEYDILRIHFNSIPRPEDADKNSGYYWNRGNRKRRIEFLKEIINTLQDKSTLQTNHNERP